MTEQFYIGQIFEGAYPPEAAIFCNENGLVIEPDGGNFIIKQAPVYEPTYAEKRAAEYPNYLDYLDAQVKKASDDDDIRAAGLIQEQEYLAACLAVKAKYPKPE